MHNLSGELATKALECIRAHTPPVNSPNVLKTDLQEIWEAIPHEEPHEEICVLIDSMLSWLRAVIWAYGGIRAIKIKFWLVPLSS